MKKKEYSIEIGGEKLTATFTDLAEQANGSVLMRLGDTVILATAVMSKDRRDGLDYFPLTVDYEERFYASGQILGSRFMRREGRPTDEAILSGRIVDRTIRPLFERHIRNEIQVVVTVLSLGQYDPDILGVIGSSLAVAVSDIPWNGPVGAVRVGKVKDKDGFIINPTYILRDSPEYEYDLVLCGKDGLINMIEVGGKEIPETEIVKSFETGLEVIKAIEEFQKKIVKEMGKEKKVMPPPELPKAMTELYAKNIAPKMLEHVFAGPGKEKLQILNYEWLTLFKEQLPELSQAQALDYFDEKVNEIIHKEAVENDRRPDGRKMDELRPIFAQAGGISPIIHGTGIFYRGGTHVLSALTLGGPRDSLVIEGMEIDMQKHFIHHYNFPPFSTGETGRIGSTNRRMIGHGALAEKALVPVIPPKEAFPYTIRIVSEALSSNGSTSMGSVCGSTLALLDAGVPIKAPVAGIASGLMMKSLENYKVLTDIQGPEDHHGDMDFKVAGTKNGVTAVQMDVKVGGVSVKILTEAFEKAKKARLQILEIIAKEISVARPDISPNAPKILTVKIKPDQIGMIIGSGGKTVNGIREETGAEIDIDDDGTVVVTGKNGSAEKAAEIIKSMTHEYKAGEKFQGTVTRLMDFGAFVKIGYDAEGLVHISEMAPWRVERVTDLVKEGDEVPVVVKEIDEKGRINLSIKNANPSFFKKSDSLPRKDLDQSHSHPHKRR